MPDANGFSDAIELAIHFVRHGAEFGATDATDYLNKAKHFLQSDASKNPNIVEGTRSNGEVVRFDKSTDEFAVVQRDGIIKTYFKPIPLSKASPGTPRYRTHTHATNYDYFRAECAK